MIMTLPGKASRTLVDREVCRAIQHVFWKPSLVNLMSKDVNLVFYLSVNKLNHCSN